MIQSIFEYFTLNRSYIMEQFFRHFLIAVYGVIFAVIIAVPIGFYIAKHHKISNWVISIANVIQTIPSLAMLSILMLAMGLGTNTVVMSVFLYSLLPIIKNTYAGVVNINQDLLDIGKGMGMTKRQIIFKVEFPLALSIIMAGIRNALIIAIGVTTVGTFLGAGGLGDIITRGINVNNGAPIIWAGAIPTALMAIITDIGLSWVEKKLDPRKKQLKKRVSN